MKWSEIQRPPMGDSESWHIRKASWQRERVKHLHAHLYEQCRVEARAFMVCSETWTSLVLGAVVALMAPAWVIPPSVSTKSSAIQGPFGMQSFHQTILSHPGQDQPARGFCSLSFRVRALLPGRVRDLLVPAQETAPSCQPYPTFSLKPMLLC